MKLYELIAERHNRTLIESPSATIFAGIHAVKLSVSEYGELVISPVVPRFDEDKIKFAMELIPGIRDFINAISRETTEITPYLDTETFTKDEVEKAISNVLEYGEDKKVVFLASGCFTERCLRWYLKHLKYGESL